VTDVRSVFIISSDQERMRLSDKTERTEDEEEEIGESSVIEIVLFKSDSCAFCPRAEEVIRETIEDFEASIFKFTVINVTENPEAAEEYGIFALPTVMIGGVSITGIPEPEMLLKMILSAKVYKKRGAGE
jgi:thioredoxin 1